MVTEIIETQINQNNVSNILLTNQATVNMLITTTRVCNYLLTSLTLFCCCHQAEWWQQCPVWCYGGKDGPAGQPLPHSLPLTPPPRGLPVRWSHYAETDVGGCSGSQSSSDCSQNLPIYTYVLYIKAKLFHKLMLITQNLSAYLYSTYILLCKCIF